MTASNFILSALASTAAGEEARSAEKEFEESMGLDQSQNHMMVAGGVFVALSAAAFAFFYSRKEEEIEQLTVGNSVSEKPAARAA